MRPLHDIGVVNMRLAVIVASLGRAEEIGQLLERLRRQTVAPVLVVLSVETPADVPPSPHLNDGRLEVIYGPKGLTLQRNRGLDLAIPQADVIVFFDDDYVPADDALAGISRLFAANPDIVGATGRVIGDGVTFGGISYPDALAMLEADRRPQPPAPDRSTDELYGCNMAFRAAAIRDLRFDETLPLYAWQEDVDFAGQLLAKGRLVKTDAFTGVHRGVTRGRSPGIALGFSQMVNPAYLVRKGTMRPAKAARLMVRNFIANHAKMFRPEPFIDRVGRARGNWLGLAHLVRGKTDPQAIFMLPRRAA